MKVQLHGVLVVAGICCALAVCEAGVRMVEWAAPKVQVVTDRPQFYYKAGGTKSFKNIPYQIPKPDGVFRVAAVGDSFTFPHLMQFDQAYPKVLERMLNLHTGNLQGQSAEVISYSQPGLSTVQEVALVKQAVREGSELIVLQITLNDPAADNTVHQMNQRCGSECHFEKPEAHAQQDAVSQWCHLCGAVKARFTAVRSRKSWIRYHQKLFEEKETWGAFTFGLRSIKKITEAHNVPLVVFLMPVFSFPLDDRYPVAALHAQIGKLCDSLGISFLDLLPAYTGMAAERLAAIPGHDGHPNEIAHRIAAESVYLWLEQERLIPTKYHIRRKFAARGTNTETIRHREKARLHASAKAARGGGGFEVQRTDPAAAARHKGHI